MTERQSLSFCDAAHLSNCYSRLSNGWDSGPAIEHPLTALPPLRLPALPMRTVPIPSVIPLAHHVRIKTCCTASGEEKEIERWSFKIKGEEIELGCEGGWQKARWGANVCRAQTCSTTTWQAGHLWREISPRDVGDIGDLCYWVQTSLSPGEPLRFVLRLHFCCLCIN